LVGNNDPERQGRCLDGSSTLFRLVRALLSRNTLKHEGNSIKLPVLLSLLESDVTPPPHRTRLLPPSQSLYLLLLRMLTSLASFVAFLIQRKPDSTYPTLTHLSRSEQSSPTSVLLLIILKRSEINLFNVSFIHSPTSALSC
jgi:hypothetical protein